MFVSVTPNLVVRDLAASLAFYRLGFTISMSVPDAPPYVFVGLDRDGHVITFAQRVAGD